MFSQFSPKRRWPGSFTPCRPTNSSPPPDDPVAPHETVIGELTDTEKAIWSSVKGLADKAQAIADFNNKMVNEAKEKGEEVNDLQVFLNRAEHEATVSLLKGLNQLLWFNLKKRLGTPTMEGGGIGVRNGYQVVSFPPDMERGLEMFAEMLMGGPHGRRMAMRAMAGD